MTTLRHTCNTGKRAAADLRLRLRGHWDRYKNIYAYYLVINMVHGRTVKINTLTLRRLVSYIYMEHPFLMFLDHTQRRSTVGRTPLDE